MRTSPFKLTVLLLGAFTSGLIVQFYRDSEPDSQQAEDVGRRDVYLVAEESWRVSPVAEEEEMVRPECPLRTAVSNDPLLTSTFQFSQPVFQWEGSLSTSSWHKLSKVAPPYGWKGVPINDVRSALSLLNSFRLFERDSPDKCVRCAVVGNGGSLRGSKQGQNINSHDLIFRVNGAVIKGFEEDVGNRTSFYVFTTNTLKNSLKSYWKYGFNKPPQDSDTKYIFIPAGIRDYVMIAAAALDQPVSSGKDKGDRPWKYFNHKPPENLRFLHPEFIYYVTKSFLKSHKWSNRSRNGYIPSTGALMLLTALHTCDEVSAYGFITKNYADFSDHYYDTMPLRFYADHDMRMECRLWEMLHIQRVLKLHQRSQSAAQTKRKS